jgi:hypothetical protein
MLDGAMTNDLAAAPPRMTALRAMTDSCGAAASFDVAAGHEVIASSVIA